MTDPLPLNKEEIARIAQWRFNGADQNLVTGMRDSLIATIRERDTEIAMLRHGIQEYVGYQQSGAGANEWSYTLTDLAALAAVRPLDPPGMSEPKPHAPKCGLCRKPFRKGASVTVTSFGNYNGLRDGGFALGPMTLNIANHTRCEQARRKELKEAFAGPLDGSEGEPR